MIALAALLLTAQDAAVEWQVRVTQQPRVVRHLIARRAACAHLAGEEAHDEARRRAIERTLRRQRCDQVEADEVALRHRYARYPQIIAVLDETRDALDW